MKSLTRAQARKKAEELRQSIREHDHAYYVLSNPVITDQEYDALMKELQRLLDEK